MDPFTLSGTVSPFTGNGRKLGYPTANIEIPANTQEGLFVGVVTLENTRYPALIFIGAPVTLDDDIKRAEAHILDFEDRDLYGSKVEFEVQEKLRDNFKFDSLELLVEQMRADEAQAREYFLEKPA